MVAAVVSTQLKTQQSIGVVILHQIVFSSVPPMLNCTLGGASNCTLGGASICTLQFVPRLERVGESRDCFDLSVATKILAFFDGI